MSRAVVAGLCVVAWLRDDGPMVKRRWWGGRSWRARAGWVLVGGALAVLGVALPVWALAGDVNAVAGWANVLALPVSAAGLVLLLADRDRDGVAVPAPARRPWMAPPLDRMVERPELGGRLVAALMGLGPAVVGLTTGLHGAGGFGKTRPATRACHRPGISPPDPGRPFWGARGQVGRCAGRRR